LRRPWGAGWALVGDAAYFKDPITAHGISDALRDAELLARAIMQGGDAALADYEYTRDALSTRLFEVTDRVASVAWDTVELKALHQAFSDEMKLEVAALVSLADETAAPIRRTA
jgi:flavin-dependent dehydrogenase